MQHGTNVSKRWSLPSLGERFGHFSSFSASNDKLSGCPMHRNDVSDVVGCRLQHSILCNCWLAVLFSKLRLRVPLETATVGWLIAHLVRIPT